VRVLNFRSRDVRKSVCLSFRYNSDGYVYKAWTKYVFYYPQLYILVMTVHSVRYTLTLPPFITDVIKEFP